MDIDAAVTSALSSIADLTWLPDIDEMNEEERERRTEELLKYSDDEEEKEVRDRQWRRRP